MTQGQKVWRDLPFHAAGVVFAVGHLTAVHNDQTFVAIALFFVMATLAYFIGMDV